MIVSTTQDTSRRSESVWTIILREYKSRNACQVDEAVHCPDVSDIRAPDGVWLVRIEPFLQDILQTFTEIGILGCCNPQLYPLRTDTNLAHIDADRLFRNDFASFLLFLCNLWCTVVLVGFGINLSNILFDFFSLDLRIERQTMKPRIVARARYTKNFQYSGDRKPTPCSFSNFRFLGRLPDRGSPSFF